MTTYTVTAERSGKWWVLQAVEVPGAISQVARLDQADEIKEAIAWVADVPQEDVEIRLAISLPDAIREHLEHVDELRESARRANAAAAEESREVARALHEDLGLTMRDVGSVLEVSHQRAHQLVKEARPVTGGRGESSRATKVAGKATPLRRAKVGRRVET